MHLLLIMLLNLSPQTQGDQPEPALQMAQAEDGAQRVGKRKVGKSGKRPTRPRIPAGERRPAEQTVEKKYTGPDPRGRMYLGQRMYLKAVHLLRDQLVEDPDARGVKALLSHALAGARRCDEARELALQVRDARAFTDEAAYQMARCFAVDKDYAEAVFWMEEALLERADDWNFWNELAIYYYRVGDHALADSALAEAEALSPGENALLLSRAILAVGEGDLSAADEHLWVYDRHALRDNITRLHIESQIEMDLGNPIRAQRRLSKALSIRPYRVPSILLRAEAIRRVSYPDSALRLIELRESRVKPDERQSAQVIVARIAVDLGEFSRARALIDRALAADSIDADALASAWYLARAEGRADGMARYARRYESVQSSPIRSLDLLVPPITEDTP